MTRGFRAVRILAGFLLLTLPLMPLQALFVAVSPSAARRFPHWYHKQVCRLVGIRLHIEGERVGDQPVLLVANHVSWLDIPVISAAAPVSFVAKKEVGTWPFVSWLAKLQRTVFVDRQRRTAAGASASEIAGRLRDGDTLVLFAEGTSSDGNRVMPFKTSLFAAVKPPAIKNRETGAEPPSEDKSFDSGATGASPVVQTLTLCYTHLHGVPLERAERPLIGWYGDMEMGSHAWELLKSGPLDATLVFGEPVPLEDFADRKALARHTEREIRVALARILRNRQPEETIEPAAPGTA